MSHHEPSLFTALYSYSVMPLQSLVWQKHIYWLCALSGMILLWCWNETAPAWALSHLIRDKESMKQKQQLAQKNSMWKRLETRNNRITSGRLRTTFRLKKRRRHAQYFDTAMAISCSCCHFIVLTFCKYTCSLTLTPEDHYVNDFVD